ncbi:MAG TPA: M28 family peptidase, partial [Thermomicrobiales bacterium]|nr:M28 family peptidase [Thermomicrobiales bacterium]
MAQPGSWTDPALEERVLGQITIDEPWALVERFSTLTRLSGEPEEAVAVDYITDKLTSFGVVHTVHHPTCLISLPGPATLRTLGEDGRAYTVKTPSFSPHTGGQEIIAELAYVPGHQAGGIGELLGAQRMAVDTQNLRGRVVITEGMGMSARGFDLRESGAVAAIFVNPGERIHEGITTTSWGTPDLDSLGRTPPVPIITINRPDGLELIERAKQGPVEVAFSNLVSVDWRPIPVIVAEIKGSQVPEEFVLFHGHLDSWHVGVGDNATGDATLLEIARVFQANREGLARSIRVAWWSGHSHGRYAGSTWYTDAFALDLVENCVSHVNCDSPGCRWATVYDNVMWMAEAADLARAAIRDVTGQESTGLRPLRAGDCSFNNLGIPLYFMLSSTMPAELLAEKRYYPVGGCGANIAWHTEDDTLEIADRDNLLRDIKVYAVALLRTLNAPLHPFDYRATVAELRQHVGAYADAAGKLFDFSPALAALDALDESLGRFYAGLEANPPADARSARAANAVQRRLGRELIAVSYSRDGRFRQDPARTSPALPDLEPAMRLT